MTTKLPTTSRPKIRPETLLGRLGPQRATTTVRPVPTLVILAILAAYPQVLTSPFWRNVGILALMFAITAMGWNVLGGYTGQISFGNAIFFGAGAYATAVLVKAGWSPWPTMMVGAAIAAAIGIVIGFPCFRLRSHYFAIATIAVGEIADIVVNANQSLGASSGINIPTRASSLANLQFPPTDTMSYYYVVFALFILASVVMWLFVRGRAGAYTQSIRDDEEAAEAVGVPARRYKLLAVGVSGAVTAVAGSFYAMYVLFVDPSLVLALSVSINIVLMVILGGAGTFWGPLVGAWALTILQEYTRQQFGSSVSGLDLFVFGLLIVVVVIVEPGGLVAVPGRVGSGVRRLVRTTTGAKGR
ncbi:MAG: branched-chain amino acid ABC transporter permease [Acidimicrobiales bacterium]